MGPATLPGGRLTMETNESVELIKFLAPILSAGITAVVALGGYFLVYWQGKKNRESDERRWDDQKVRDETFRTVQKFIEALADWDYALAVFRATPESSQQDAKEKLMEADRELNRAKQVLELLVEYRDPGVVESIRELRRRYAAVRVASTESVQHLDVSQFHELVDRKDSVRAEVQEKLVGLLRSYSRGAR